MIDFENMLATISLDIQVDNGDLEYAIITNFGERSEETFDELRSKLDLLEEDDFEAIKKELSSWIDGTVDHTAKIFDMSWSGNMEDGYIIRPIYH